MFTLVDDNTLPLNSVDSLLSIETKYNKLPDYILNIQQLPAHLTNSETRNQEGEDIFEDFD